MICRRFREEEKDIHKNIPNNVDNPPEDDAGDRFLLIVCEFRKPDGRIESLMWDNSVDAGDRPEKLLPY